jgi:hypothetical protein
MKIGFTGTGGTGKTTAATQLLDKLEAQFGVKAIIPNSAARAVFNRRGITEAAQNAMTPEQAAELQAEIWAEREAQEESLRTEDTVWDRTLLDHFIYALMRTGVSVDKIILRKMEEKVARNLASYDLLVHFPLPEWEPEVDPLRDPAQGLRHLISLGISGYLAETKIPHIRITKEAHRSPDATTNFLIEQIRERDLV